MPDDVITLFPGEISDHVANSSCSHSATKNGTSGSLFSNSTLSEAHEIISNWPGYQPTPLISLSGLAGAIHVAQIYYKDEGSRFGLGSFKALGGAYAVNNFLATSSADPSSITVTSATDGNHGLSVAWGANTHGCRCVIFIHSEVSAGREQALKSQGAEVIRIDGNYDESVRQCYVAADDNNWTVISDTSRDEAGFDVARTVMAGYSVMVAEIVAQLAGAVPTHVFVQGGVGGLAATVCEYFRSTWDSDAPRFIIVEPELAPCLIASARQGKRVSVEVREETVMAGLSCGEVSLVAWPTLSQFTDDFLTIPDSVVAPTMRLLADAPFNDSPIIAGESSVAGLAGLICSCQDANVAAALQLNKDSQVLVIGTDGATDPMLYESLTGRSVVSVELDKI